MREVKWEEEEQRQRGCRGETETDLNSETRPSLPLAL